MKNARLGDYLLWKGEPAQIVGEIDRRTVVIEPMENKCCPHCNGDLGKERIYVIVSSPLFQESAGSMPTIADDPTLIVT